MKKAALGVIALAMSFMVTTAHAADGDIRSIFPCDMYGNPVDPGTMATAHKAGETLYFCVRLENSDALLCYNNKVSNPWMLKYDGMYDLASALILTPPAVGVYVSGRLTAANVVLPLLTPANKPWYTDVICSYTVKPGDMAFPMTLALASGKEVGTETDAEYLFDTVPMSYSWGLYSYEHDGYSDGSWGNRIATNECTFAFGDSSVFNNGSYSAEINSWIADTDLRKAGLYIKTVEFAAEETTVPEGRTERVNVNIEGGVNTNGQGVVYAMIRDDAPVSLAESGVSIIEFPNPSNAEMAGTYQVAAVTIPSGADVSSFSFRILGETKSDTPATVYLATTKGFVLDGGGVNMITNFITTKVRCVEPPPPYISVTLDGEANKSVTSGTGYAEYATKLTVALSEAYTSDVTVEVTPSMISGSGTDPLGKYIGMSTYSENGFTEDTKTVTFTADEMAGGTLSKDLYIYVLGGDDDTDGVGKGIKFAPAATGTAASYFDNENVNAILYIKKSTPQILYPTENYSYSGLAGGVNSTFSIKISDDYNNMKSPFTVEWLKTGSGSPQTFTVTPNSDGEASVSVRYNAGEYTTRFRVKNASGVYSDYRTVSVQVNPAKQVSAVIEDPDDSGEYNETEEELTVRFKLTEAYEDSTLYAFLVPMDAASSNLVTCKAFEQGIAIRSGDTESTATAKIMLLDGSDETLPLIYSIALRTARTWDSGETIGTYESKDLEIYINNVAPTVAEVNMSGSAPVTTSGGTFGGKASMGLNKIFTLAANDVEADLTNDVTSVWTFSDPNGNAVTRTVTAPIDDIVLTNVFEIAGTYSCTVKLQDKDMSSKKYGEVFEFKVEVLNTPSVAITFPNSNTYNETDADKGLSYFYIDLSTAATAPLEVEIVSTQVGLDGVLNIATNRVAFRAGQVRQTVLIDDLDGTANSVSFKGGFSVTAKVITDTKNEDGIAWSAVYIPATEKMYVANEAPTIVLPLDTGMTNDAAINVYTPIKWKIDDVSADLTNDLTVTWTTSEGRSQEFTGSDVFEGVFTNIFTSGGAKTVTITVTDKDDSMSSVTLYYKVSPSKLAKVFPMGPYYGGLTALSRMYATAAGIGEGRVWGNGGSQLVEGFVHKYTYGFSDTSAEIHAWGYKNGQVDDGSLASGRDIAINGAGESFKLDETVSPDDCYVYSDASGRDSFFYAWLIASKEEEATTYTGTPLVSPLNPKSKSGSVQYSLSLPTEQAGDQANPVFPDSFLEVFFAKELYTADNMGDMNADGVPDYFATLYWALPTGETKTIPEAMTGQAIAGSGGEEGEGESATASDLAKINSYNDDLDFLPVAWRSANPIKPAVCNWGPGDPFTALKEIRGVGIGLNEPGVSDYDLTEAETAALYAACALAGSPAADYAAATNWAKSTGWTPEAINKLSGARLNPLSSDTDGDVFDDGWEYYFWYYSKFGAIVDGKWSRLEGRRFDFSVPGMSVRISPDEIAAAFDPHVVRETEIAFGIDFDNDGLTDLEEYALGTNPCDWDSDGDGAADLWEVLNGLNPLSSDGDLNPDCDFMAKCEYAEDTFTLFTFADGRTFALPTGTAPAAVPVEPASTSSYYKVEMATADATLVYWTLEKPVTCTVDGATFLAEDVAALASLDMDSGAYLGEATVLTAGAPVVSVADDAAEVPEAALAEAGLTWTDPATLDRKTTAQALEVFNYGGDGVTFVPCTTNVTTYVKLPVGTALVKITENVVLTLLHDQVNTQFGFDPRVAWNVDRYGFLDTRWRAQDSDVNGSFGFAGVPTNTVAYASRDEFLLLQYRAKAKAVEYPLLAASAVLSAGFCASYTTFPNLPIEFVRSLEYSHEPFTSTNDTYLAYWDSLQKNITVHGADTDFDGVPDGWELYVGSNPNVLSDGTSYQDDDKLTLVQEYAGIDSCNAYTNRFDEAGNEIYPEVHSITRNNPGVYGNWWNKFFPTNPAEIDTDGDGLLDHEERDGYSGTFYVGRNEYRSSAFTFIYGDNGGKYAADGVTTCFRGGGLNPCTVDTDGDLLPDAWEHEFAGIVLKGGTPAVALSAADFVTITAADGIRSAVDAGTNTADCIIGGMDGTFKGDAAWDFDHDGLMNFQEYLVQSLRHLRYDDALTPLMGVDPSSRKFVRFIPFSAWDGNAFHARCVENGFTGLGAWQFRKLGYFTLPPHIWDPVAMNTAGLNGCANYKHSEGAGYRVMLRPSFEMPLVGTVQAAGYATTDPRRWDSDDDGMDDYYEIFHGLNPLLGSSANPAEMSDRGMYNYLIYDVIASKYGGTVTAWSNPWTDYDIETKPAYDPIRYPWMIGTMECDADGDGLRNDEESLKVDLADPMNTHTDPTPLWMTDSTSAKSASFTAQYYDPDPYLELTPEYNEITSNPDLFCYPWTDLNWRTVVIAPGSAGINRDWMFSFEENEGYDTDHDFKRDTTELVAGVDPTSDPLDFSDPVRRQALYLPGDRSAAVSYDSESRRSVGTEPDLLKQFTVECWVRPDEVQHDVVLIERVCVYGDSTLQNNANSIRANFRIGFDSEGRVYGEYEGSTVDSGAVRVTARALTPGEWTHIAFRYDGSTAAIHLNGDVAPSASVNGARLIPANGIDGILQETGNPVMPYTGYRALPCANIIGARALTQNAVSVNPETAWSDFSSFYKGWIDEIRVWDGARTASEIHADYLKRYTVDDISAFRETVFRAWRNGATRSGASTGIILPPELLLHYNFATLPGGVEPQNVIQTPPGFASAVLDNVRKPNGMPLDASLAVGWWSGLENIRSTVYADYAFVPWIPNTVGHLPMMDGSSVDSRYWSSYSAGVIGNAEGYDYPNSANPYPSYVYRYEKVHYLNRLTAAPLLQMSDSNGVYPYWKYAFQLRSDFVGTTDLVPLGTAFAKRGTDFWDGSGAMDVWTATHAAYEPLDSDGDGIPDWAWNLGYTTVDAYLRALSEGLLPSTGAEVKDPAFKDIADVNHDGLYDWWQRKYDLKSSAQDDTDKDGLADFAEYLVSEVFMFGEISPVLARTNGKELDYFRKAGRMYLGGLFSDHDFMEDEWENSFKDAFVDSALYDPSGDADADGWSNYAECRARTLPDRYATITAEGQQIPDYPEPTVNVKVNYRNAASVTAPILVKAFGHDDLAVPDATWVVPGSGDTLVSDRVLGVNPGAKTRYTIGPGTVVPGTVYVSTLDPSELTVTDGNGVWGNASTATWRMSFRETPIEGDSDNAKISAVTEPIGTINYSTGAIEIDFPALQRYRYELGDGTHTFYTPGTNTYIRSDLRQSYFKIQWQSKRLSGESMWKFSLSRATIGHIREGLNTFEVVVDLNGNGIYDSGEPIGVVKNVDVGWSGAEFEVEVLDEHPVPGRVALGLSGDETSTARNTSVRVTRHMINKLTSNSYGSIQNPEIGSHDIGNRTYLHEGDFTGPEGFDIDWARFGTDVLQSTMVKNSKMNVTQVTYRVSITSTEQLATNTFDIVRLFTPTHLVPTPVDVNHVNYGARPVFTWTFDGAGAETYTAFSVRILDSSSAEVWNSGFNRMPPKGVDGRYSWKAPLSINDLASAGKVFSNTNNYTWQISAHNSKYQTPNWSSAQKFRMNAYASEESNNTGRYGFTACVKYFGPGVFSSDKSSMKGVIRVEAYTTPDFKGVPAARTFLADSASVTNVSHEANVKFVGLESGTYYILAFIDSDGDGKRSAWESWGYACPRGDISSSVTFAPSSVEVGFGLSPKEILYIEDTDADQDTLPDVYEYDTAADKSGDFLAENGVPTNDHNGYITVNPELQTAIDNLINAGQSIGLLSMGSGMVPAKMAALALGVPTLENSVDEATLAIKAIALEDGNVKLTLGAAADEPAAGTVFVSDGKVTTTIVIRYADTLGGEWSAKEVTKTFEIKEGAVSDTFEFSLEELGLDASKGFFKVELKQ